MKLAFITQDFIPEIGGIQTYSLELSKRLSELCDEFFVMCPKKKNADDNHLPFPVYRMNSSNNLLYRKVNKGLKLISKTHGKIDATFHAQWQTVPDAIKAKDKGLIEKVFVACHARELLYNPYGNGIFGKWYHNKMIKLLNKVDHFFPVSEYTKSLLLDINIPEERITIITNGTNPNHFFPIKKDKLPKEFQFDGPVLLTITRLVERKGIDVAIQAFSRISEHIPTATFLIGGEGDQKQDLESLVISLKLENSIKFLGKIPYKDLNVVYNACDVFVLPSRTILPDVEGFGIVFLEANACKKPVVGSDSGGIPSAIIDGVTGFIVSEDNVEELTEKIEFLFNNTKKANEMGKNGLQQVLLEANWDKQAFKLFKHIQKEIE